MKAKAILFILLLSSGCENLDNEQIYIKEIDRIDKINNAISSEFLCNITVEILEKKNAKELKIIADDFNNKDDFFIGRMFFQYLKALQTENIKFDKYVINENKKDIYAISHERASLIVSKVDRYQILINKLSPDAKEIYNLLNLNSKNGLSIDNFSGQMRSLDLKNLEFGGIIPNDSLLGICFDNKFYRINLVSSLSNEQDSILGLDIKKW